MTRADWWWDWHCWSDPDAPAVFLGSGLCHLLLIFNFQHQLLFMCLCILLYLRNFPGLFIRSSFLRTFVVGFGRRGVVPVPERLSIRSKVRGQRSTVRSFALSCTGQRTVCHCRRHWRRRAEWRIRDSTGGSSVWVRKVERGAQILCCLCKFVCQLLICKRMAVRKRIWRINTHEGLWLAN